MGEARIEFHPVGEWAARHPSLPDLAAWAEDYLSSPHPGLGRGGPVCPFVPKALRYGDLRYGLVPHASWSIQQVVGLIESAVRNLAEHQPTARARQAAAILVFSEFSESECRQILLAAHREAKPSIIARGLMLGEFFPGYELAGVRRAEFRAGHAPLPLLVVRRMVRQDVEFLHPGASDLLHHYAKHFGDRA